HMGTGGGQTVIIGESGGVETVTLTTSQIPAHSHVPTANAAAGNNANPTGLHWAQTADTSITPYSAVAPDSHMAPQAAGRTGGSQPHDNMIPYLCVNFIISLFGVFPTQ